MEKNFEMRGITLDCIRPEDPTGYIKSVGLVGGLVQNATAKAVINATAPWKRVKKLSLGGNESTMNYRS